MPKRRAGVKLAEMLVLFPSDSLPLSHSWYKATRR